MQTFLQQKFNTFSQQTQDTKAICFYRRKSDFEKPKVGETPFYRAIMITYGDDHSLMDIAKFVKEKLGHKNFQIFSTIKKKYFRMNEISPTDRIMDVVKLQKNSTHFNEITVIG